MNVISVVFLLFTDSGGCECLSILDFWFSGNNDASLLEVGLQVSKLAIGNIRCWQHWYWPAVSRDSFEHSIGGIFTQMAALRVLLCRVRRILFRVRTCVFWQVSYLVLTKSGISQSWGLSEWWVFHVLKPQCGSGFAPVNQGGMQCMKNHHRRLGPLYLCWHISLVQGKWGKLEVRARWSPEGEWGMELNCGVSRTKGKAETGQRIRAIDSRQMSLA